MAVKQVAGVYRYIGLSTDTKPAGRPPGSTFYESDTGIMYIRTDAAWVVREASRAQFASFVTTIDLDQAAGDYDLAEAAGGDCIINSLAVRMPDRDASSDVTLASISVQTDDATPFEFISAAAGAVANLTAEAQLVWAGTALLAQGQKIQLTIAGGAADAATVCKVVVRYSPVVAAAHLE